MGPCISKSNTRVVPSDKACEMVYVIGGAGVGKSTYIREKLAQTHQVIDPDTLRTLCPHQDPDPDGKGSITYKWTKRRSEELLNAALKHPGRYAFPGTGKTTGKELLKSKKAKLLKRAAEVGFHTRLIYLYCSDETALQRNEERPRRLTDETVLESLRAAEAAFEALRHLCHEAQKIDVDRQKRAIRGRSMSLTARPSEVAKVNAAARTSQRVARFAQMRFSTEGETSERTSLRFARTQEARTGSVQDWGDGEDGDDDDDDDDDFEYAPRWSESSAPSASESTKPRESNGGQQSFRSYRYLEPLKTHLPVLGTVEDAHGT